MLVHLSCHSPSIHVLTAEKACADLSSVLRGAIALRLLPICQQPMDCLCPNAYDPATPATSDQLCAGASLALGRRRPMSTNLRRMPSSILSAQWACQLGGFRSRSCQIGSQLWGSVNRRTGAGIGVAGIARGAGMKRESKSQCPAHQRPMCDSHKFHQRG